MVKHSQMITVRIMFNFIIVISHITLARMCTSNTCVYPRVYVCILRIVYFTSLYTVLGKRIFEPSFELQILANVFVKQNESFLDKEVGNPS